MGVKDTDSHGPALGSQSTSTQSILEDAKKTKFDNPQEWKSFQKKHYTRLTNSHASLSNTKRNVDAGQKERKREKEVLDEILSLTEKKDNKLAEYQPFVRWAIKHHRQLLTSSFSSRGKPTPLAKALIDEQHEFVSLALQHVDKVEDLLGCKIEDQNCLQYAINYRSPFAEAMVIRLHKELSGVTTAEATQYGPSNGSRSENLFLAKDVEGMTALHIAVTHIEAISEDEPFIFVEWNELTEESDMSVKNSDVQHPQHLTRGTYAGGTDTPRMQSNVKRDLELSISEKEEKVMEILPGAQGSHDLRDDESGRAAGKSAGQSAAGPAMAPMDGKPPPKYLFNRLGVVRALILADHDALCRKDNKGDTPFQTRLQALAKAKGIEHVEDSDQERRKLFEEDEILTYMREYIIGKFPRKQALDALYKEGSGLGKVLRFEGLLKYVALPRVAFRNCRGLRWGGDKNKKPSRNPEDEGNGCQDMCDVFQWLRDCGVTSIMTVRVIDDGDVSHSDEAIEQCVNGFGVRSWNWYRVDLPCDVILTSAKEVRDVALYSSGNNAVLAGWASPSGLVKLAKLEKLHVVIQKGLERRTRLEKYAEGFEQKIIDQRPEVKVTYTIQEADVTVDLLLTDRDANDSIESLWMRTMVDFGKFLAEAKKDLGMEPEPVKIAIIDDGINPTLNIFNDRIRRGESFHQLGEDYNGRRGSFYVPSGPHGTLMAQLVCKICPMVELYIAQLEVFRGHQGQRSFRAGSAADAVTWAVNQGVDIISMSWYINEDVESESLELALQDAARKKIVMFCSSVDEGAAVTRKTYPGNIGDCIKIGACTDTGAKLSWVSSDCHFLLPGDARHGKVRDGMTRSSQKSGSASAGSWSQNTMESHGHFGSSVSTALAAGLAGTLLFTERLGRMKYSERLQHKFNRPGQVKFDYLRDFSHMTRALASLSTDKFIHWDKIPAMGSEPWFWDRDAKEYESKLVDFISLILT